MLHTKIIKLLLLNRLSIAIVLIALGFILGVTSFRGEPVTVQEAVTQTIITQATAGLRENIPNIIPWQPNPESDFTVTDPDETPVELKSDGWSALFHKWSDAILGDDDGFSPNYAQEKYDYYIGGGIQNEWFDDVPFKTEKYHNTMTSPNTCTFFTPTGFIGDGYIVCE